MMTALKQLLMDRVIVLPLASAKQNSHQSLNISFGLLREHPSLSEHAPAIDALVTVQSLGYIDCSRRAIH